MCEQNFWAFRALLVAFCSVGMLAACGSSGDDSPSVNAGMPPATDQPSTPNADMDLFGQWLSTCRDAEAFGLTEDDILSFEGATVSRLTRVSASGDCSTPVAEVKRAGTYGSGMEIREGVRAIDLNLATLTIKPLNETGVAILRLANFCSIADWTIGVERDVTAQSGGTRCFERVPKAIFDIYSVEGERLFFGLAGGDRSMRANRPTELNRQSIFSRQ